jgi:hypothetical protein
VASPAVANIEAMIVVRRIESPLDGVRPVPFPFLRSCGTKLRDWSRVLRVCAREFPPFKI